MQFTIFLFSTISSIKLPHQHRSLCGLPRNSQGKEVRIPMCWNETNMELTLFFPGGRGGADWPPPWVGNLSEIFGRGWNERQSEKFLFPTPLCNFSMVQWPVKVIFFFKFVQAGRLSAGHVKNLNTENICHRPDFLKSHTDLLKQLSPQKIVWWLIYDKALKGHPSYQIDFTIKLLPFLHCFFPLAPFSIGTWVRRRWV